MFLRLLLLFVALPLLELAILVRLGMWIGFWPTMALVFATGFLGATLARSQGFRVWSQIRRELQAGRMPVGDLVDGLLVLIGGIVLLTPGLLTDLLGLALLFPPTRATFKGFLRRKFDKMIRSGRVSVTMLME